MPQSLDREDGFDENEGKIDPQKPVDYNNIVGELPERMVVIPDEYKPKTLGEEENETEQKTDLQAVLKYLHPQYRRYPDLNDILQSAAASRIFPDNLLDKHYAIAAPFIEQFAEDEDFDIMGVISVVQDALSRGYEGKQRIEDLEVGGVIHEEEMEKLSQDLGLGR